MIKGIIFDADGTLPDSMHIWEEPGERYLAIKGIKAEDGLGQILYPMTLEQSSRYLKEKYSVDDSTDEIIKDILGLLTEFYQKEALQPLQLKIYQMWHTESSLKIAVITASVILMKAVWKACKTIVAKKEAPQCVA